MPSQPNRVFDFWNRRPARTNARRRPRGGGMVRSGAEQLESRAMLAVTVAPVLDWNIDLGASTQAINGGANARAGTNVYTNVSGTVGKWVLDIAIDDTDAVQDVYMRVVNNNYVIATDASFSSSSIVYQTPGNLVWLTKLPTTTGFTDASGKYTAPVYTGYSFNFDSIYVRLSSGSSFTDGTDTPSFTIVGASQNVAKTVIVDLVDRSGATPKPLSDSAITVAAPIRVAADTADGWVGGYQTAFDAAGSPINVGTNVNPLPLGSPINSKAGGIYSYAESISLQAGITSAQDLVLDSQIGAANAALGALKTISLLAGNTSGSVVVPGNVTIDAVGTGFTMGAGAKLTGNAAGTVPAASVTLSAQDADVVIGGTLEAVNQSYFLMPSASAAPVARTITTKVNGVQKGKISGGSSGASELLIYLANDAVGVPDGAVDIQTSVNTLRTTSLPGATLDYAIAVKNDRSLIVDAVARSQGDIALSTTAGTINLQAAIDTEGSFSLSSFADLNVDSSIASGKNIALASTNGGVTTSAAIQTANSATGVGRVTITAKNDVQVNSLVNAEYEGVTITSQTGKIFSGTNLAVDPTSRVTSPSTKLTAVTGINLGTDVGFIDAAVTGTGDLAIDDSGASGYAAVLTVTSATTAAGSISIKTVQSVDVSSLVAGGTGDASITSTGGDINLAGTVIADANAVTLTAAEFAADGVTVLNSGFITGRAPIANEISWTASNVVDDATRSAITVLDYIGATTTFETNDAVADGDLFYFTGPAATVPEGFSLGTAYYVVNSAVGAPNTFQLSLTPGGAVEGGPTDLAGPIDLEPGNTDLYRNIPVVSAYRLSAGGINFTADNSTTLKSIKTTDGDVNVTSAGGSIIATSVVAKAGANYFGDVALDARNGGVTLGSVATTSAAGTVSVLASQGIADDGNAATTGITANTINLSAATGGVASDIGSATNRVTVAGVSTGIPVALTIASAPIADYPAALDASSVYIGASSGLGFNAAAVNLVDVRATGAATDVEVQTVALSDEDGKAVLFAGRNLTVGNVTVAGGAFGEFSSISLEAGGRLVNANGVGADTSLEARALTLKASTFDGSFDVTNLDTFERLTAAATAAGGGVNFKFDRAKPFTLDGITTVGGNVTIANQAVAVDPDNDASIRIGAGGITAGTATSANTVTLTTKGAAISGPTDSAEATGTIFAASSVTLTAADEITAVTKAGQLVATADSSIDITQTGNTKIGSGGIATKTGGSQLVNLAVTGSILSGTGKITTDVATVSATTGMDIKTNVGSLSATAAAGNVTVLEDNGLEVGAAGITATSGAVSLTLTKGTLVGGGPAIKGNSVALNLLQAANSIDVDTSTSSLTASTKAGGNITIRNDKNVAIGAAGIVVGNTAVDDVSLSVSNGAITGGTGSIKADAVSLSATTGITANTSANSLTAASTAGNIALTQTGKAVTLASLVAANGGVTVTNNDNIAVTQVQAIGSGKNVSLTATGVNKKITFGVGSITADGDSVSLLSTGGLDGTSAGAAADITAASIKLGSSGGDVTATVKATTISAGASGTDTDTGKASNLDLTVLGSKPLFVGTTTGLTLGAAGNVTLRTKADPASPPSFGLPIIVVASPTAGGTVTYNTDKQVTFAVSTAAATGAGSLSQALTDSGAALVTGGGTTGVGFSSTLTSPIQLSSTLAITKQTTLDGTQRLNLATGSIVVGRAIDIDGSKLAGANTVGFALSGAADNSVIRGFAFYGFNKTNGAAISLSPSANGVTIANNLFGTSTGGATPGNTVGILAVGNVAQAINNLSISGNTVVKSTDAGIRLGTNVTNASVTGNLIGTNSARAALGNGVGIDVSGAGGGNTIGGAGTLANVVANNSVAGIQVTSTTGGTTIRGNEVLQNLTGVLVNGTSDTVTIAGNTVTRNTNNGVVVNGTSSNVTVGGVAATDRNFIGTTSSNALGLGNGWNGVVVSSTGAGNTVTNNVILGNGTANVGGDNAGVKLTGNTTNGVAVTGNTVNANRGAGILAARTGTGVATITKNAIASNSGSGVQVSSGTVVVGSAASETNETTIRGNANTINSNARYGVEVLAGAFAQIAGNSMASNLLGGILNAALTAPTVTSATRSATTGLLTITVTGVTAGQVVHFYTGTDQGRTYLGRVAATGTTATFTMTLAQQTTAGVSAAVFVGAPVTATRSTTGVNGQTSSFAAVRSIVKV
ncbi:MAG: right-handed parallel beta-helix repeat-containing protein [Planctomycetia bacterium]